MEKEYAKVLSEYEFDKVVDGVKYSIYYRYEEIPLGIAVKVPKDGSLANQWFAQNSVTFENYTGGSVEDLTQYLQKVLGR